MGLVPDELVFSVDKAGASRAKSITLVEGNRNAIVLTCAARVAS